MEIGSIAALRPVIAVTPSRPTPELEGVFQVEFPRRQQDESYTSSQSASRGLEDEDSEETEGFEVPVGEDREHGAELGRTIRLVA
jgi:hypothetical protein